MDGEGNGKQGALLFLLQVRTFCRARGAGIEMVYDVPEMRVAAGS